MFPTFIFLCDVALLQLVEDCVGLVDVVFAGQRGHCGEPRPTSVPCTHACTRPQPCSQLM